MTLISRIEEILLLAIWKLKEDAYGMAIRKQVERDTHLKWLSEAIYAPLSRLTKKGYVRSHLAEKTTEKGGRPRVYYRLTRAGFERLVNIQEVNRSLWIDVPDLKKDV